MLTTHQNDTLSNAKSGFFRKNFFENTFFGLQFVFTFILIKLLYLIM